MAMVAHPPTKKKLQYISMNLSPIELKQLPIKINTSKNLYNRSCCCRVNSKSSFWQIISHPYSRLMLVIVIFILATALVVMYKLFVHTEDIAEYIKIIEHRINGLADTNMNWEREQKRKIKQDLQEKIFRRFRTTPEAAPISAPTAEKHRHQMTSH